LINHLIIFTVLLPHCFLKGKKVVGIHGGLVEIWELGGGGSDIFFPVGSGRCAASSSVGRREEKGGWGL
jgi:hypothetical protein